MSASLPRWSCGNDVPFSTYTRSFPYRLPSAGGTRSVRGVRGGWAPPAAGGNPTATRLNGKRSATARQPPSILWRRRLPRVEKPTGCFWRRRLPRLRTPPPVASNTPPAGCLAPLWPMLRSHASFGAAGFRGPPSPSAAFRAAAVRAASPAGRLPRSGRPRRLRLTTARALRCKPRQRRTRRRCLAVMAPQVCRCCVRRRIDAWFPARWSPWEMW